MTETMVAITPRRLATVPDSALVDYRSARAAWNDWRRAHGYAAGRPFLTLPGDNLKLAKGQYPVLGLSLAPARTSGRNVCAASTRECRALCLATAGNGRYDSVTAARILRTQWLWADPVYAVSLAVAERDRWVAAHRDVPRVGWRPNILSDIPWETVAPAMVAPTPRVRAYDYTKLWDREGTDRYRLTYSRSERTDDAAVVAACQDGRNVAVVFSTSRARPLPERWLGVPVVDGDVTDWRVGDPHGVIVGLRAKGRARDRRYLGGFVVDAANL